MPPQGKLIGPFEPGGLADSFAPQRYRKFCHAKLKPHIMATILRLRATATPFATLPYLLPPTIVEIYQRRFHLVAMPPGF